MVFEGNKKWDSSLMIKVSEIYDQFLTTALSRTISIPFTDSELCLFPDHDFLLSAASK